MTGRTARRRVLRVSVPAGAGPDPRADLLAVEEPLEIRVGGEPLSVTMRTPGDDIDLAAGFLAAEGVISSAADLSQIKMCDGNVADVTLALRPRVVTTHGLHLLRRAPLARPGVALAVGVSRVTLCTSHAEGEELRAALPPRLHGRLAVVPNGIEPIAPDPAARAAARAALGLEDDQVAGLFLGELADRKDPLVAARAARAAGPPFVLLVAGDGPLAPAVRAAEGRSVRALGFRDDPETLLAAADVFVLPSRREGLSFAVLEAMGHGLAMVVADGAGNPEAVGDAGLVLPAGDERAFADALARLAADPALRASLGAAAKARVEERFTAGALRAGVRTAYERAAGR